MACGTKLYLYKGVPYRVSVKAPNSFFKYFREDQNCSVTVGLPNHTSTIFHVYLTLGKLVFLGRLLSCPRRIDSTGKHRCVLFTSPFLKCLLLSYKAREASRCAIYSQPGVCVGCSTLGTLRIGVAFSTRTAKWLTHERRNFANL